MVLAVDFLFFSSHFPEITVLALSFEEDPGPLAVLKAEILPESSFPVFYLILSVLAGCYPSLHYRNVMLLLLHFPFTATLLEVVLTLLGEEKPLLIRLPSRSSCHFLFLSYLLQSSHRLLCFFFPFLPQSFCSPPARVKPGVSFPHLPCFSRHVAFFDAWCLLLPPRVFLA